MTPADVIATGPIKVLDQGHVALIDVMGSDESIYDFARRSYRDDSTPQQSPKGLIRYCARHRHDSIFAAGVFHLEVDCPIYVARQLMRYRTFDYSEFSQRYSEVPDRFERTTSDAWRLQDPTNKQGSAGFIDPENDDPYDGSLLSDIEAMYLEHAHEVYCNRITGGVAREQARKDLPLSTYTTFRMIGNLRNLFHVIEERNPAQASGPQHETREFAKAIAERFVAPLFPLCWGAFQDYRLNAMTLSQGEVLSLYSKFTGNAVMHNGMKGREVEEYIAKLTRLGLAVENLG